MKRAIGWLVLIFAVTLFGAYVNSVRADAPAPCVGGAATDTKYEFCHNGHTVCVGDPNEIVDETTGHSVHGIDHPGNPPRGCSFIGCCDQGGSKDSGVECKKDGGKTGS
jgi:hypothetical protein